MYKAMQLCKPSSSFHNQPPAVREAKSSGLILLGLPGYRWAQLGLDRRSFGVSSKDVFKVVATSCSGRSEHSFHRDGIWSAVSSRSLLHCSPRQIGSPVDIAEESLDHSDLCKSAHSNQHDVQQNAKMVARVACALVLFTGTVLLHRLAPASASLAVATASSNATIMGRNRILGMIGGAEVLASAWTGLMAGCLHTLTGPDHLAALAPLSIGRTKLESVVVGALWGCGHDAGQVLFGILFLLLKDRLHIEVLRTWGARVVGMTLLAIGALGIKEAQEVAVPCIVGNDISETNTLESADSNKRKVGLATFTTGIIHGLQPDALLMVLPALALPSRLAGAAFLCMFLFGTVLAMGSYTAFIGSCSQALRKRVPRITERLTWCSSLLAIFIGSAILVNEHFGGSLF